MPYIVKIQDGIVKYLPADDLSIDFTIVGILNVDTQINIGNSKSPTSTITSPGNILLDATNTGVFRVEPTSLKTGLTLVITIIVNMEFLQITRLMPNSPNIPNKNV